MPGKRPRLRSTAAANYIGRSPWWTKRAARDGILPHYRIGERYEFDPDELDAWLQAQHRPAKQQASA